MQQPPSWGPPQSAQGWSPQPPPSNNRLKLAAIGGIALLCVLCGVVGVLAPPPPAQSAASPASPARVAAETPASHEAAAPPPPSAVATVDASVAPAAAPWPEGAHHTRETWTLGECNYTVTSVFGTGRVGDRYVNETASPGATFVVIHYAELNNGRETILTGSDNVKLRDTRGRTFSPSTRVQVMLGGEILPELQPGVQHEQRVGFEVPAEVTAQAFDLVFEERGFGNTDTETVHVVPAANPPVVEQSEVTGRHRRRR